MARVRLWLEGVGALAALFLGTLTLIVPDWLEAFGFEPDGGNGTVEWIIALGFAVVAAALAGLARRDWLLARQH